MASPSQEALQKALAEALAKAQKAAKKAKRAKNEWKPPFPGAHRGW